MVLFLLLGYAHWHCNCKGVTTAVRLSNDLVCMKSNTLSAKLLCDYNVE